MNDITQVLQCKPRSLLASDERVYEDQHLNITDEIIAHKSERLNWFTTIALVIFHAGAIAALFFFTWKLFLITVGSIGRQQGWGSAWVTTACIRTDLSGHRSGLITRLRFAALSLWKVVLFLG